MWTGIRPAAALIPKSMGRPFPPLHSFQSQKLKTSNTQVFQQDFSASFSISADLFLLAIIFSPPSHITHLSLTSNFQKVFLAAIINVEVFLMMCFRNVVQWQDLFCQTYLTYMEMLS